MPKADRSPTRVMANISAADRSGAGVFSLSLVRLIARWGRIVSHGHFDNIEDNIDQDSVYVFGIALTNGEPCTKSSGVGNFFEIKKGPQTNRRVMPSSTAESRHPSFIL